MEHERPLRSLSDDELLQRLAELLHQSRRFEADLVAHIAEVDERRLYAREACPATGTSEGKGRHKVGRRHRTRCHRRLAASQHGCGGHAVENLSLLCKAHNAYLAQVDYGCPVDLYRKTQRGRGFARERTLSVPGYRSRGPGRGIALPPD